MYLSRPFVDYHTQQAWAARRRLALGVSPAEYRDPAKWVVTRKQLMALRTPDETGYERHPTFAFVQELREAVGKSSLGDNEKVALLNRCLPQEGAQMFTAYQVLLLSLVLKRPTYLDWVNRNVENGNELDRRVISMLYDLVHNMLNDPPFDTSHFTAPFNGRWR
jgi:hypothetical protein